MNKPNYDNLYTTCVEQLREEVDLKTNLNHYTHCFRNLSEEYIARLFEKRNAELFYSLLNDFLTIESENRIQHLAAMKLKALMAELS